MSSEVSKVEEDDEFAYPGPRFPLPITINTHTDEDTMIMYLQGHLEGKVVESPKFKEQKKRWQQSADWLREYHDVRKVIPMLMKTFSISESQAIRDCDSAKRVYNTLSKKNLEGKEFNIETYLLQIEALVKEAREAGDFKSAAKLLEQKGKALKDFFGGELARKYQDIDVKPIMFGHFSVLDKIQTDDNIEVEAMAIANSSKKSFIDFEKLSVTDVEDLNEKK